MDLSYTGVRAHISPPPRFPISSNKSLSSSPSCQSVVAHRAYGRGGTKRGYSSIARKKLARTRTPLQVYLVASCESSRNEVGSERGWHMVGRWEGRYREWKGEGQRDPRRTHTRIHARTRARARRRSGSRLRTTSSKYTRSTPS